MSTTDNNAPQNLASLKLPELRKIAAEKGLRGISGLRKGDLIKAIETGKVPAKGASAGKGSQEPSAAPERGAADLGGDKPRRATRRRAVRQDNHEQTQENQTEGAGSSAEANGAEAKGDGGDERRSDGRSESRSQARRARRNRARREARNGEGNQDAHGSENQDEQSASGNQAESNAESNTESGNGVDGDKRGGRNNRRNRDNNRADSERADGGENGGEGDAQDSGDERGDRGDRGNDRNDRGGRDNDRRGRNNRRNRGDDDDNGGRRGRRNRRNRRNRGGNDDGGNNNPNELQIREGDELQAVGGILEVVDNNVAFLRTTGYRAAASDVFVHNKLVRGLGLRSGDAITGQVKVGGNTHTHGNGRNRRKYNQLVRVDSVNGMEPTAAKDRPEFSKLTPLYPNQRLRLETTPNILTTRVIDLIMPIGKGQRALIVSPPKAGKTTILQNIANAISTNNPECYLMVVLVDERPEEVTDMQRSVKGEVISSTFDRPPSEHTSVAELAIERAKRLVEQGKDVVVLLDSITRLGRAYNNSSPASGRILSGGVDSNALYPPKRFLGAARNIENGGSLTIIATAMVETGSTGDTVIFEEFKGTGNAELKLDRSISERRVFPAVDVNPSGTRKDELLLVPEEARIMTKLRRILSNLDSHQAIDLLIKQLKKTKSNGEFLMGVASSAPMVAAADEEDYS